MDIRSRNFDVERRLSDLEHDHGNTVADFDDGHLASLEDTNDFTGNNYFNGDVGLNGPTIYIGPIDEPKQIVTKEYVDALEERVRHLERLLSGLGIGRDVQED